MNTESPEEPRELVLVDATECPTTDQRSGEVTIPLVVLYKLGLADRSHRLAVDEPIGLDDALESISKKHGFPVTIADGRRPEADQTWREFLLRLFTQDQVNQATDPTNDD